MTMDTMPVLQDFVVPYYKHINKQIKMMICVSQTIAIAYARIQAHPNLGKQLFTWRK